MLKGEGAFAIWTCPLEDAHAVFAPCDDYDAGKSVEFAGTGVEVAEIYEAGGRNELNHFWILTGEDDAFVIIRVCLRASPIILELIL